MTQPPYSPPNPGSQIDHQPYLPEQQRGRKKSVLWAAAPAVLVIGAALAGCGGSSGTDATAATAASASTTAAQPPVATEQPAPAASSQATSPVGVDFAMPDVVGLDLQSAQDVIQTNGVFFSTSHHLLGSGQPVLDRTGSSARRTSRPVSR